KLVRISKQMRAHRFSHGTAVNAHLPTLSGIRRRQKMRVCAAWANACVALPDCNAGAARLPTLRARREWVCTEWWANACTAVGLRNVGVARLTALRSFPFARSRAFDPHVVRNRQRLVGAVEELDGDEVEIGRADVLKIVHLVMAGLVGLVARLARHISVLDGGAVVDVRAGSAVGRDRPEIVEHVAVEAEALAGLELDLPHAHAIALRKEPLPDAAVGVLL